FCARNRKRIARSSGSRAGLSLRHASQRNERQQTFRASRIGLGSSVRTQFVSDEIGAGYGRTDTTSKLVCPLLAHAPFRGANVCFWPKADTPKIRNRCRCWGVKRTCLFCTANVRF